MALLALRHQLGDDDHGGAGTRMVAPQSRVWTADEH
jgi:hypothetical protein